MTCSERPPTRGLGHPVRLIPATRRGGVAVARRQRRLGILIDGDSTITGNVIRENASGGILLIVAQGGTRTNVLIRDKVIVRNTGSAVLRLDACLVWANIIRQNTSGVSWGGASCLVSGNVQ